MSSNPLAIPIGTSDPVDLCYGLPLFPFGTARAGAASTSRSYKLLDASVTILITRLKVSAYASYGFGVCGPAIAFLSRNVEVDRANSGGKGQLTLTFNEGLLMEAGAFASARAGAGVTLGLQVYLPKPWYKFWAFTWQNVFSVDIGFNLDLIELLFALIQYLLSKNSETSKTSFKKDSENRLRDALPGAGTYSMVDTAGSSSTVAPNLAATPTLTLPINLVNYFPPLKAFNDALAKIGGEISVGPSLHLQFPVTFNFSKFTVVGGLDGAASADYGNVRYVNGNQVSATGNTQFNTGENPSRVTTQVTYTTAFRLALSSHFRVTVAKFINIGVNGPSLDLYYLLYSVLPPVDLVQISNSVSTNTVGGCVLTPNMTLTFLGPNGTNPQTGEPVKGFVTLPGFGSSSPATVALEIDPPAAGFPGSVTIPARSDNAAFTFTFQNQCLATGNRNDPSETAPPSPVSPLQTYLVRAKLMSPPSNSCSDYEVEAPLNIANRFLRCWRLTTTPPGVAPPWDPRATAIIKADIINAPGESGGSNIAHCTLWFPYLDSEPTATVRITFTLLDENRQPYSRSDVVVKTNEGLLPLTPSATGTVTLARSYGNGNAENFAIYWRSKGQHTGYSNRFYLTLNAGCQYGQTEFWLDVYNWS